MWKKIRALLFGAPKDVHSGTHVPQHLARGDAGVGRPRGRRAVVVGLRPGRGVPELVEGRRPHVARRLPRARARRSPSSSSRTPTRASSSTSRPAAAATSSRRSSSARGSASSAARALLVDYVLTITTSIASGGDAIFSMIPRAWFGAGGDALAPDDIGTWLDPVQRMKVVIEIAAIVILTILNIRGVKESVTAILPDLRVFVVTHAIAPRRRHRRPRRRRRRGRARDERRTTRHTVASARRLRRRSLLFVRAYSLGGGTYTGIEAVSNGVQIMREPRVRTAKRTMVLMATSLRSPPAASSSRTCSSTSMPDARARR